MSPHTDMADPAQTDLDPEAPRVADEEPGHPEAHAADAPADPLESALPPEEREDATGDEPDGDDPQASGQQDQEPTSPPTKPKTKPDDKPKGEDGGPPQDPEGKDEVDGDGKPKLKDEDPDAEDNPWEDFPDEDWGKLSHEGKRRICRRSRAAKDAIQNLDQWGGIIRTTGLNEERVASALHLMGNVHRGNPDSIPVLENLLMGVRSHNGIAEPSAAPVDRTALEAAITKAREEFTFDDLDALVAAMPPAAPPAAPAGAPGTPRDEDGGAPPPTAPGGMTPDAIADRNCLSFLQTELEEMGSQRDLVEHYQALITEVVKDIGAAPAVDRRFDLIQRAHQRWKRELGPPAPATQPPAQPASTPRVDDQPLSGSGRRLSRGAGSSADYDPLEHSLPSGQR